MCPKLSQLNEYIFLIKNEDHKKIDAFSNIHHSNNQQFLDKFLQN